MIVECPDDQTDLYGLRAENLQRGIIISENAISGTLLYVSQYKGFAPDETGKQSGYYLALKVRGPAGARILVKWSGDSSEPVDITEQEFYVCRVASAPVSSRTHVNSTLTFTLEFGDDSADTVFDLSGITCQIVYQFSHFTMVEAE